MPVVPQPHSMQPALVAEASGQPFACAKDVMHPEQSLQGSTALQQKMFRQRQLALKRQRELSKNAFGAIAQQNPLQASAGFETQKKAGSWGKFFVEHDGNPVRSEVSTPVTPSGSTTPGRVTVVAAVEADSTMVVGAMEADTSVRPATGSLSLTSSLDLGAMPTVVPESETAPAGPCPQPIDLRNQAALGAGWDLEISADDMRKSPKESQNRGRKMWPWNRGARVTRIAEEDTDRVSAFDDEVECIRASSSKCNLRAKTPWSPCGTNATSLTEVMAVPGELQSESSDKEDLMCGQPHADSLVERSRSPFDKDAVETFPSSHDAGTTASPQRTKRTGLARLGLLRKNGTSEQGINDYK